MSGLRFVDSRGTAVSTSAQFAVVGDTLAYAAGSGVIVGTLSAGQVTDKWLYVANGGERSSNVAKTPTGTKSIMNTVASSPGYGFTNVVDDLKDSFGYPMSPIIYGGANETENKDELASPFSTTKLKDRVRAVTCLAISPNKRVLAIGESGYQPRVLLFSLAKDASRQPFAVIYEHKFGINHVAFSPDSKHLCSLGNISDGYIHVWRYSGTAISLRASNKCSSVVHSLIWHDSNTIITCGLRFLKCWSFEPSESVSKAVLKGRNIILGRFLDSNFRHLVSINQEEVLVTDGKKIFVLALQNETRLCLVYESAQTLQGLVYTTKLFYFGESQLKEIDLGEMDPEKVSSTEELKTGKGSPEKSPEKSSKGTPKAEKTSSSEKTPKMGESPIKMEESPIKMEAISPIRTSFQTSIPGSPIHTSFPEISPIQETPDSEMTGDFDRLFISDPGASKLSVICAKASGDCILYLTSDGNISCLESGKSTVVVSTTISNISGGKYSADNTLLVFSKDGKVDSLENGSTCPISRFCLPKMDFISNELTAVEKTDSQVFLGDKYGTLYVLQESGEGGQDLVLSIKLHSSTINDIVHFTHEKSFLCTISRDRMIQVLQLQNGVWELLQTLPTHTANLISVKFSAPYLYVCSADRTVSIHEVRVSETVEIIQRKVLSFKNSPLAMEINGEDLVVSTSDRALQTYSSKTFEFRKTLKLYSDKTNEALCIEKFLLLDGIICAFSTDKSLRTFQLSTGKQLACVWGHMEPLIGLYERDEHIVSLGKDGCLFQWKIGGVTPNTAVLGYGLPEVEMSPVQAKVARKILPVYPQNTRKSSASEDSYYEPDSPTPRLTSATLKRIEAKRRASLGSNTPENSPTSPSRSQTRSPSRSQISPSRTQTRTSSTMSPSKTQTSPSRTQTSPSVISPSRIASSNVPKKASERLSPVKKSWAMAPPQTVNDAMERSTAYISTIRSFAQKELFCEEEKTELRRSLRHLLCILGDHSEADLLNRYSEKLLSLMEQKMVKKTEPNDHDPENPETPDKLENSEKSENSETE